MRVFCGDGATHASGTPSWTVFDQDLVDKVLEDHNLPTRFARFMVED
jgi:hypothetical protein